MSAAVIHAESLGKNYRRGLQVSYGLRHTLKNFLRVPLAPFRRFLKRDPTPAPPPAAEEMLASLDTPFRAALLSMYRGEPQHGSDGQSHAIDVLTRISPSQGMWIYNLCLSLKPKSTLEIGMAYGFSSLFFLAAIARNQGGRHCAVDPFQRSHWNGIGLAQVSAVGMTSAFSLVEDRSDRASADFARDSSRFDVIFIDGNHRFDDVLVDFYLYAPLCLLRGFLIFDDLWMASIQSVVAFVRSNRPDFVELLTPEANIAVFQRVGDDSRDWRHFQPFAIARNRDGRG